MPTCALFASENTAYVAELALNFFSFAELGFLPLFPQGDLLSLPLCTAYFC